MGVKLRKGEKVDLTKNHPNLKNIVVGLGWDSNSSIDLDASAFLLSASGKVNSDSDFIFYNNPSGANGSIMYSGDKRSGAGNTDAEQIKINLSLVPQHIVKIAFSITIYDAAVRRQSFGQVGNSYVRIFNENNNEELLRFELGRDFSVETAIVFAELYRHNSEWKFSAIGSGFSGGLNALCQNFGVTVDDEPTAPSQTQSYTQSQPSYTSPSYTSPNYVGSSTSSNISPSYTSPNYVGNSPTYNNNPNQSNHQSDDILCPRCSSSNITTGKKGFGLGKAAIGGLLLGPIGVLGGFIGGNDLVLNCNRCGNKWTFNNRDYAGWINEQKNKAKEVFYKYKGADVLDAVVASCALVSMADGRLDPSEKEKMLEFFNTSEALKVFDLNTVHTRFNYFIGRLGADFFVGRAEALRFIGAVKNRPDIARLIVRYCIAVGYADGNFDSSEQRVVSDICTELGLNPGEFLW